MNKITEDCLRDGEYKYRVSLDRIPKSIRNLYSNKYDGLCANMGWCLNKFNIDNRNYCCIKKEEK